MLSIRSSFRLGYNKKRSDDGGDDETKVKMSNSNSCVYGCGALTSCSLYFFSRTGFLYNTWTDPDATSFSVTYRDILYIYIYIYITKYRDAESRAAAVCGQQSSGCILKCVFFQLSLFSFLVFGVGLYFSHPGNPGLLNLLISLDLLIVDTIS